MLVISYTHAYQKLIERHKTQKVCKILFCALFCRVEKLAFITFRDSAKKDAKSITTLTYDVVILYIYMYALLCHYIQRHLSQDTRTQI
jgi:hypothetical protein